MPVDRATWWRRHPVLAGATALVSAAVLVAAIVYVVITVNEPALTCGPGMQADAEASACIGIDLAGESISPNQPDRLSQLVAQVKHSNDEVTGPNYVSIVLLLDLSPVAGVDTTSYDGVIRSTEGAIAAVWQANHTAVLSAAKDEPDVKLFLANMGSRNAEWKTAADQIAANAKANHVTSVVGMGQSTDNTRKAIRELTVVHHIPVIGATVTGNSMNYDVTDRTNRTLLSGFFRVAPTNSGTVSAAAHYVRDGLHVPITDVAVAADTVAGDDYVASLVAAARTNFRGAHWSWFNSPDINADPTVRVRSLRGQLTAMDTNLCDTKPRVIYFAGRGTDLGTFVQTLIDSNTGCAGRPLIVLTGDDGIQAVHDRTVAAVVANSQVQVQYTALASPGKWDPCSTDPAARRARYAYDQFQAAFTGLPSCTTNVLIADAPRLKFPMADLDNGEAILTHDAVGLATVVARRSSGSAVDDPGSQIGVLLNVHCKLSFPGASGTIQFNADPRYYGNPVGAVLPILNVTKGQTAVTIPPSWPVTGGPAPRAGC